MKIAYISNADLPSREANSIHVMQMARALAKWGHDVTLVAPRRSNAGNSAHEVFAYYGVEQKFRIVKLPWFRSTLGWLCYGFLAARLAKRLQATLVYGRNLYGCWWAACVFQRSVVWEVHELPGRRRLLAALVSRSLARSKRLVAVVAITHSLRMDLIAAGFDKATILVAPDGAPSELADPTSASQAITMSSDFTVGYVGHLYAGKGMEVIAELTRQCPWAHFHVVGGMEKDIAHWKGALQNCSNITFHGHVDPTAVKEFLYAFDVVVAPLGRAIATAGNGADISRWTSPLKIFEYMAAGRAIVASDLPVLREVLEEGCSALLRPVDNLSSWVEALRMLKEDVDLRRLLGANARAAFLAKYTWERRAKVVLEELRLADDAVSVLKS